MGGKALKRVKTRRLAREEYLTVERQVVTFLAQHADLVGVPRYFDSKESFGDLDVVYCSSQPERVVELFAQQFGSQEKVRGGHVCSLDFQFLDRELEAFQVDLILVKPEHFMSNLFYLSYSDMGAILGMLFKSYGLGYGGDPGLFHQVLINWIPSQCVGRLTITHDPVKICQVLGLDPRPALESLEPMRELDDTRIIGGSGGPFSSHDEIFDYISSSPLFNHQFWTARALHWNHKERDRAKTRPMYGDFLTRYIPGKYGFVPNTGLSPDEEKESLLTVEERERFVNEVLDRFGLKEARGRMIEEYRLKQQARERFNGQRVSTLTGLTGPSLGLFMKRLVQTHPSLTDPHYLSQADQDEIDRSVSDFFREVDEKRP
jgi:hypothetical protein